MVTESPAVNGAEGAGPPTPASTGDHVYGLVVAFGLIVLLVALLIGVLTGFTFSFCGCTTQPAPSPW